MKRLLLLLSLATFLASCDKDEGRITDNEKHNGDILQAAIEPLADGTRATLKDGTSVVWTVADVISVVGTAVTDFTLSEGAGTTAGKFEGNISKAGEEPYFAVFPKDDDASFDGNHLKFSIAKEKKGATGNIPSDVLPMAAEIHSGYMDFHNLVGLLKISLTSSVSVKFKKATLHDLGGNMLWGECCVPFQADTLAYGEMTLSGGDNTTSIVWDDNITVSSEAQSFFFCVPAGALDRGFSIVLYEQDVSQTDQVGKAYTFLQKYSSPFSAERSVIINMDCLAISEKSESLDEKARGYYKSLFVNGGVGITHWVTTEDMPWIKQAGLADDYEYLSSSNTNERDSIIGLSLLAYSPYISNQDVTWNDQNGVLLYPDGQPRFRAVYVNGGSSTRHGRYLTQTGRDNFHNFYYNGGSYVASCAGTFLAAKYVDGGNCYNNPDEEENFSFGIWPGELRHTNMPVSISTYGNIWTAQKALVDFGHFNEGDTVELVRHHGGSFLPNTAYNEYMNPQPERLFSYQYTLDPSAETDSTRYTLKNLLGYKIFGSGNYRTRKDSTSIWAYKNAPSTGRAVLCGSHPENSVAEKQIQLMVDMMEYALEGNGTPECKAELELGSLRQMNADWSQGTPAFAKIGDRQYHHFKLNAPEELIDFELSLNSDAAGIDLYLALRKDGFAFISDADYVLCNSGAKKSFRIKSLPAGTWYVGVYCATTVTTEKVDGTYRKYFKYTGNTETQNGIAYTIKAEALVNTAGSLSDFNGEQISWED